MLVTASNRAIKFASALMLVAAASSAVAQTIDTPRQLRSPHSEECITEEKIVQENDWTTNDEFARYIANDAHLFAETLSPDPMRRGPLTHSTR